MNVNGSTFSQNLVRVAGALALAGSATLVSALAVPQLYTPAPPNEATSGGLSFRVLAPASNGWVPPGGAIPYVLKYKTAATPVTSATVSVTLPSSALFVKATPTATSGNGTSGSPLLFNIGPVASNSSGSIVIEALAKTLAQDPQVMWKNLSADVTLTVLGQSAVALRSHGPKVTTLDTARYGDRSFPVVMVDFQDIRHCSGDPVTDHADCTGTNHTATALDTAVNSRTSGKSIWQLYQDLSFGQLYPDPTVMPRPSTPNTAFDPTYNHKFSQPAPNGSCSGTTVEGGPVPARGTPAYPNRVVNGWYVLPGTQGYYGSDSNGAFGAVNPVAPTVDDGCGPTSKLVYDAATLADPDLDYNDFDTDKDGLVDFFNLVFPGVGGNTLATPTSINNIWPHSSSLEYDYVDPTTKLKGYISNDRFRNQYDQLMYYTDNTYRVLTTTATAFPAYVRVGPYNVNPETAMDAVSVIAHEYGHSLGLPDFYSNDFDAFGSWELMGTDYFQYMAVFSRQDMGWVVPRPLASGVTTLRESKYDTGEIHWTQPDGTPYTLTGDGIHNADVYRVQLPPRIVIDAVPSGSHAWHSGAGSEFGCPPEKGHNLDVFLPDLKNYGSAGAVTLTFKSLYQVEWDWDYGFVMVSDDGGLNWVTLPSALAQPSTIQNTYNPNNAGCFDTWNNGITGVYAGGGNTLANPNRPQGLYPFGPFFQDQFDLTAYKGKSIILRFSYFTDPAAVFRGWFIDDIKITADSTVVYSSDFEGSDERGRLFSKGWTRVSTLDGSPADHAYYLELRDRLNNDFDGKGQSDRGVPGWQAGLSMIYTDEAFGYGNTGVDDHPAQTPVDSNPQPGNTAPNLNDAAFTLARPTFNGCTHIDNYGDPNGPDENWKLPTNLKFTVTALTGLQTPLSANIPNSPATVTINAEVNPICAFELLPPVLSIGTGYENPDTNGAFQLTWTRPLASVGPDLLQEATVYDLAIDDDAEGGLGKWTAAGGAPGPMWTTSNTKPQEAPNSTFWASPVEQGGGTATLTYTDAIVLAPDAQATLNFRDWLFGEDAGSGNCPVSPPDSGFVDISSDGGPWETVYTIVRPMGDTPDVGAAAFADEALTARAVDLAPYAGHSINIRFRFFQNDCDYLAFATYGYYVDDVKLEVANFKDLSEHTSPSADLSGKLANQLYYRVRTRYPAVGGGLVPSPWSNVLPVNLNVQVPPIAVISAPARVLEGTAGTLDGKASSDPNGDALTFAWAQLPGSGPSLTLSGADTDTATFTAPTLCTDVPVNFRLTVSDAAAATAADVGVILDNANHLPVASAGADFLAPGGAGVMLSGAATHDDDCEPLTYRWGQVGGPEVTLLAADTAAPTFTAPNAPVGTELTFRLTVRDPDGTPSSDDVTVTLTEPITIPAIGNTNVGALSPFTLLLAFAPLLRRRRALHR
jgi:M6 family metalloprotease-like protein